MVAAVAARGHMWLTHGPLLRGWDLSDAQPLSVTRMPNSGEKSLTQAAGTAELVSAAGGEFCWKFQILLQASQRHVTAEVLPERGGL